MLAKNFYIAAVFIFLQVTAFTQSPQNKLIRVLIVDGYSNHDWRQTTIVTKKILEESKLFVVNVSTAPATTDEDSLANWEPQFNKYDVIIQNTNNINDTILSWPRKIEIELEKYVAAGGGLYILHSANNSFPNGKEYDEMIGLGWRPKETGFALVIDGNKNTIRITPGEGAHTSHGKRFDALIHILNRNPINHGYPSAWMAPSMELYTYARGPAKNLIVLSYAYDSATNKNWPVGW